MKYSLISNSCIGWYIYKQYHPHINHNFIDYTNPFISSIFLDDEKYVKLCENYDYYTSLEPRVGDAINDRWFKDTGKRRYQHNENDYIVFFLDDIEIHWIHDTSEKLLLRKYNGRLKKSKEYEPLFLWCEPEIMNIQTEKERLKLVNKFNKIDHKTIFLTKYKNEEHIDKNTIVKFIPEWEGKSQNDRDYMFRINWYDQITTGDMFKKIIDNIT